MSYLFNYWCFFSLLLIFFDCEFNSNKQKSNQSQKKNWIKNIVDEMTFWLQLLWYFSNAKVKIPWPVIRDLNDNKVCNGWKSQSPNVEETDPKFILNGSDVLCMKIVDVINNNECWTKEQYLQKQTLPDEENSLAKKFWSLIKIIVNNTIKLTFCLVDFKKGLKIRFR